MNLVVQGERVADVDTERAGIIRHSLQMITTPAVFLSAEGGLNFKMVTAARASLLVSSIRGTPLEQTIRGLIAEAHFIAGECMHLNDAVPFFCSHLPDREKKIVFRMFRAYYVHYDDDSTVCMSLSYVSDLSQDIIRTYPMTKEQWLQFPRLLAAVFRDLGQISNWRAHRESIRAWNAEDYVEQLYDMMTPSVRRRFCEYEYDGGPMALDPSYVQSLIRRL